MPNVVPPEHVTDVAYKPAGGGLQYWDEAAGGWAPTFLGGSLPDVFSAATRDSRGRVTAFTDSTGSYTIAYDVATGLVKTVSNGTTTRTISRDSSGLVTGVA